MVFWSRHLLPPICIFLLEWTIYVYRSKCSIHKKLNQLLMSNRNLHTKFDIQPICWKQFMKRFPWKPLNTFYTQIIYESKLHSTQYYNTDGVIHKNIQRLFLSNKISFNFFFTIFITFFELSFNFYYYKFYYKFFTI